MSPLQTFLSSVFLVQIKTSPTTILAYLAPHSATGTTRKFVHKSFLLLFPALSILPKPHVIRFLPTYASTFNSYLSSRAIVVLFGCSFKKMTAQLPTDSLFAGLYRSLISNFSISSRLKLCEPPNASLMLREIPWNSLSLRNFHWVYMLVKHNQSYSVMQEADVVILSGS